MTLFARAICFVALTSIATCRRPQSTTQRAPTPDVARTPRDANAEDSQAIAQDHDAPVVVEPSLSSAIEAVRRDDWTAARDSVLALPEAIQRSREARYILARSLLALHAPQQALVPLEGLESMIPSLAREITRLRGSALARAERHAEARSLYEQIYRESHDAQDLAHAAIEADAAGDHAAAARVMSAWADHPPDGIDRARAWRLAALCLEATANPTLAARAWRKLAVREPDDSHAAEALAALTRLQSPLSREEQLDRCEELNSRARYQPAIDELTAIPASTGPLDTRRLHLLGRAYFGARNRYREAHDALGQASQRADNPDRDEDAFLAARALARSDDDDRAVVEYDRVAQRVRGRWGDEAAFRAAWIVSRAGRTDAAAMRFREFLHDRTEAQPAQRSEAAWELGWTLYNASRFADAAPAFEQSALLAPRSLEKGRGRYWAALAWARSGDASRAVSGWQSLITERPLTYYALLSETRLLARQVAVVAPALPAPRRAAPSVRLPSAALWLRALGFDREAASRIHAAEGSLRRQLPAATADEAIALTYLSLGYAYRAYSLAQRHGDDLDQPPTEATRWVWDCAYPRPHASSVEAAEDANQLPRHYLFAIMRQESAFNPHDVSSARAIGLLQMIPPTTRRVARELGIEFSEERLYDPAYNIRVGGHYIGRLFAQYQAVLPRSIGAYNAGPGAMARWVRERGEQDLDVFAEAIPFDETRIYVRRVQQNLARYRYLYGPREPNHSIRLPVERTQQGVTALVDY
ncbi:MAG: lytic transglycosylase domain-containing protein [Deltaproteobacteria bacterium]|nr:lytic transglycosylase domain-containing protein [Deltaproteobacteria bacterium]